MKFNCSQFEDYNLTYLFGGGGHASNPLVNRLGLTVEFSFSLEKSWKIQRIPFLLETVNPVFTSYRSVPVKLYSYSGTVRM